MPRGDRTGPPGGGGAGAGRGIGRGGAGGGRMRGSRPGSGPGGQCVCPSCGTKVPHQLGMPCYDLTCPQYGSKMIKS